MGKILGYRGWIEVNGKRTYFAPKGSNGYYSTPEQAEAGAKQFAEKVYKFSPSHLKATAYGSRTVVSKDTTPKQQAELILNQEKQGGFKVDTKTMPIKLKTMLARHSPSWFDRQTKPWA
jgi:hypothetical protein